MFAPAPSRPRALGPPWVVVIVDDEPDVHDVSRLVLSDLEYDGRTVEILSAHSGQEGRRLFEQRRDIAVALIDVVMEHDRAGLDLVKHLRDGLGNKLTRVILRTGQPGMAPEREIVAHFEIDDYKEKTELTADRLHTAVYAALRAYQALWGLEQTRHGLSSIADAAGRLMGYDSTERFFAEALREMAGMAAMVGGAAAATSPNAAGATPSPAALPAGLAVAWDPGAEGAVRVLAGTGEFTAAEGRPLGELLAPVMAERVLQVASQGGMARDDEWALLGLDAGHGQRCALWVRCAIAPSKEASALWQMFSTKLGDVARARRAIEARTEMAAAERELRAKSRFMSRMSHELRTPLNAMLGFTQLMMSAGEDEDRSLRQERLHHIATAGRHLLSLIDDVLDLSRLEGGEVALRLESVPLAPLLDQILPLVAPLAQAHGVQVSAEPGEVVFRADATRLRQVLLNLLTNAIKYNRPGGTVLLRAESGDLAAGARLTEGPAGHPRLRVIDTGRGLSATQIRQLFQPFNRLGAEESDVEGTGIGLAIVKGLVERMGGVITATSTLGEGSTFTVCMPPGNAAEAASGRAAPAAVPAFPMSAPAAIGPSGRVSPPAMPPLSAGFTVQARPMAPALVGAPPGHPATAAEAHPLLYIEDNPVNALIVAELVKRRADLVLHLAEDGSRGLASAQALRPALILLDMQLPDMDGHEVFRRLRSDPATARIPCIALSANALPADIDRALSAGFAAYLTKPFEFQDFLNAVDAHLPPPG